MHDELEIQKKSNGYIVNIMSWRDDVYDLEELVFQDSLDVVEKVLHFLGYGAQAAAVADALDEEVYVLTDKGRRAVEEWERLEQEKIEAAKRGRGRGVRWHSTPTY